MNVGCIISDDHVVVSAGCQPEAGFFVEPLRSDMYLRRGSTRMLPSIVSAGGEPSEGSRTRIRRDRAAGYFSSVSPLIGLAVLDDTARGPDSRIDAMSRAEGFLAVVAANSYLSAGPPFASPSLFMAAERLVCRVPICRLSVGSKLLRAPKDEAQRLCQLLQDYFVGAALSALR